MSKSKNWFDVDKEGLAKLQQGKPKTFIIHELFQNAWDEEGVSLVTASLEPIPNTPKAKLIVMDDAPEGFSNLAHAFTLFAESSKKGDPTQRGRFNLGEKLVLACCEEATIRTTKGVVSFNKDGRQVTKTGHTDEGSIFSAIVRMTRVEFDEVCLEATSVLPPKGITTIFNGSKIQRREPILSFEATLPTEISDEEGILKKTSRKTEVHIHEPANGEQAMIYEMGIPVVETGDKYHIDIQQKVPLNRDRDNVTPAYLRQIRTEVLNRTYDLIDEEEATHQWVNSAIEDERVDEEAVVKAMDLRFGKKRVIYDPSDEEANALAVTKGYQVVHGGSFSSAAWGNIKSSGAILPAGQVTPSPKPFDPNGEPLKFLDPADWTSGMHLVAATAKQIAKRLLGRSISVIITNDRGWRFGGAYGPSGMLYISSIYKGGHAFFDNFPENKTKVFNFLIHEFAHEYEGNHLSEEYHKACTRLGGELAALCLDVPEWLEAIVEKEKIAS